VVDVFARVLDIAAQLAPFVRAHTAAIRFGWRAHVALRLTPGSVALRLGPGALLDLGEWPETLSPSERTCRCRVRGDSCNQAATNCKKELHAALPGSTVAATAPADAARAIAAIAEPPGHPAKGSIAPPHRSTRRERGFFVLWLISGGGLVAMDAY
jgi:hypothetical protein